MKQFKHTLTGAFALFLGLAFAAPMGAVTHHDDDKKDSEEEHDGEDADEEEDADEFFAVVDGDVFTGTGAVLRGATVLSKNGVIEDIGYDLDLPDGTQVLRVPGQRIYPGLVALSATSRISRGMFAAQNEEAEADELAQAEIEIEGEVDRPELVDWLADAFDATMRGSRASDRAAEGDDKSVGRRPERMDAEDAYDPFNPYLILALSTGITTAEQSGTSLKLKRGTIEGVGMSEKYLSTFAWSNSSPASKKSTREKFASASKYIREYRDWDTRGDKDESEPSKKGVDSNALKVLRGESWARFSSNTRSELLGIARLAQEFKFRPVVYGAREGWTVADELGRAGAYVVMTPRSRADKDERFARAGGSSIENAAKLHAAGVTVTVIPASTAMDLSGIAGRDLLHLPIEAGFAVRGGLSEQAALESITINPARIMGVDHRIGSIEVGKDCDLIVTDGDILHYETFVQWAVVAGEIAYDKEDEIYFAHIRPRTGDVDPLEVVGEEEEIIEEVEEESADDEDEVEDHDEGDDEKKKDEDKGDEKEEEKPEGDGDGR